MSALTQLTIQTFVHPREVAQSLVAERFNLATVILAVAFVVVITGVVQFGVFVFSPESPQPVDPMVEHFNEVFGYLLSTPFLATIVSGCLMIVAAYCVYLGGQMIGGKGQLLDVFALMTWINFVQAIIGAVQIGVVLLSPMLVGVATLIGFMAAIALFRSTLHFIDVLHGFDSLWAAFGTLLISGVGLAIGLAIIIAMIGSAAVQTGAI